MKSALFAFLTVFLLSCSDPSNSYRVILADGTVVTAVDQTKTEHRSGDSVYINRVGGSQWIIVKPELATEGTDVRRQQKKNKNTKQATTYTDRGVIQ